MDKIDKSVDEKNDADVMRREIYEEIGNFLDNFFSRYSEVHTNPDDLIVTDEIIMEHFGKRHGTRRCIVTFVPVTRGEKVTGVQIPTK